MLAGCADNPHRASLHPAADAQVAAYAGPDDLATAGGLAATGEIGYGAVTDDGFALPAIPTAKVDPQFLRQEVSYPDGAQYEPGTVVVDTANRFLYVVEANGMAMRYGIGVGRQGFSWAGDAEVHDKQHWPKWFPPAEMIDRKPELEPYREGMQPGLTNPLGARALYLWQNGKDTLFRLHGTPEWWTIGTAASSGCIRLMNQDIVDLYNRVPLGAKVVVKQGNERLAKR
ncbi:L,D-transpeptidase [Jiella sp. MQZ13P-4]|uniref:L,D-transpeptidase n=2 Tax=Jiella sonneratiae TaxID=2816856 RepID=A0ABS3J203_9HYPH|nr:L,D-transpeptidase [Jiella sonneratiae]